MTHEMIRASRLAAACLSGVLAVSMMGCGSASEYKPAAQPPQLAAYAASIKYPLNTQAVDNPQLTAIVDGGNNQLTVHNYSDGAVLNVNLWLNQSYVLHVDKIPGGGFRIFNMGDFYNSVGNNDLAGKDIKRVQVETTDEKLMNVQGPQQM